MRQILYIEDLIWRDLNKIFNDFPKVFILMAKFIKLCGKLNSHILILTIYKRDMKGLTLLFR